MDAAIVHGDIHFLAFMIAPSSTGYTHSALSDHTIATISRRVSEHEPELLTPTRQLDKRLSPWYCIKPVIRLTCYLLSGRPCPGDPWSGHMAFPGGHMDDSDLDLVGAAVRETEEEIGLDLRESRLVGPLSHQRAAPRGRTIDMLVAPYVFVVDSVPNLTLNHEVDEVVWGSFNDMFDGLNHDIEFRAIADAQVPFNGYRIEHQHFVWGLTYRTLQTLFTAVDPQYSEPVEPS